MHRSSLTRGLLVLVAVALAAPGLAAAPPDLHVIIVADTDDAIGPGCYQDLRSIQGLFRAYAPKNRTVKVEVFAGKRGNDLDQFVGPNNFNQGAVLGYLQSIELGPQTGVLLYYSGHGDYTTAEGHRMVIPGANGDRMPNEEVFRVIARRNLPVRMVAVITDSCAPNVGAQDLLRKAPKTKQKFSVASAKLPRMTDVMDDLFFKPGPANPKAPAALLDINGAAENQLAYGPNETGGFFTVGLKRALETNGAEYVDDANKDGRLSWHEVFPRILENTEGEFKSVDRQRAAENLPPLEGPDGKPQKVQTPQAFRLPDPGPGHKFKYSVGVTGAAHPDGGMRVQKVAPGSPAAGQLMEGDIVRVANGRSVRNFSDFAGTIDFASSPELKLKVVRNNAVQDITIIMKQN